MGRLRQRAVGRHPNVSVPWPLHLLCIVFFIFMEIKIILFLGIRETFEQGAGQEMEPLRGLGPMVIIPVENLFRGSRDGGRCVVHRRTGLSWPVGRLVERLQLRFRFWLGGFWPLPESAAPPHRDSTSTTPADRRDGRGWRQDRLWRNNYRLIL